MPRQRLVFSDTDPQCTDDSLHNSGTYDSDPDLDSPSPRKIGLTISYDSSEKSPDSHLHTKRTSSSEAAAEDSFAGVGKTERYKEPSRRVENSLTQYQLQIGPNYSYQVQIDGNGRLRRLSEIGEDGRERRLSLRSFGYENDDSPFSDIGEDEPTTLREHRGRGNSLLGQSHGGGYADPPSPQGHTARSDKACQDEYETEEKQDEGKKGYIGRGQRSHYGENEDTYSGFWTELRADME